METDPKSQDDVLAELIKQAGRREQPPRADYERVLSAATETLQAKLRQRRRRRATAWLSAGLAAAAVIVAVVLNVTQQAPQAIARIDRAIGTIDTRANAQLSWTSLRDESQALFVGEWLRTSPGSRLGVALADGISLRLDASTEVELLAIDRLALRAGKIYIDTGQYASTERQIEIETAMGTATDIGTQFEIRYRDNALRLRVREGQVNLTRKAGEISGTAGDQLLIDATGQVQRARISLDDPDWSWTELVAPTPDLNERSVSALLDWVGRETGRTIRYEQPILELRAETTILHGSIRNLEPLKALDVMLATTDFEYDILDDGTILIGTKTNIY